MNRTQAMKEASRLWGKNAAVQDRGRVSSPELRAAASAQFKAANAARTKDETREARKARMELLARAGDYRYSVGTVMKLGGVFSGFFIKGQGDTWEEAFAKALKDEQRAA